MTQRTLRHITVTLASLLVVASGAALAQPVNDDCTGALPIAPPQGYLQSRSPITAMFGAATTTDVPFSCATTSNASVWYSFTPAVTGRYELQTCDDFAPGTSFTNTVLAVYSGTCGALTELVDGCDDNFCSSQSRVVVTLNAGVTYYLQVAKTTAPVAADTAQVTITMPSGAESCSGTVPALPINTSVPVVITASGTDDAQVGGGGACYSFTGNSTTATIQAAPGRDVVHRFVAPRDGLYSFRLSNSPRSTDSALYLTPNCTANMTPPYTYTGGECLAAANRQTSSTLTSEEVPCVPLTALQQVYVWVDEGTTQSTLGASFGLQVSECVMEVEPNDDPTRGAPLSCGVTGFINPAADADFFALGPAPANARAFAMVETGASGVNLVTSYNVLMRVTTDTDTIEYDNGNLADPFGSTGSGVAGTPLAAGVNHFLRLNHATSTSIAGPYHVYSVIQTGSPRPEVEPNDTPAQATTSANNYFQGTVPSTADVDFFAFDAFEGELIYLALDSSPSRTGSTSTGNHTLALWGSDGQRVFVNDFATAVNNTLTTGSLVATTPAIPSEHIVYRVPTTGTYYARVGRTSTSTTATGDYLLSVSRNCTTGGGIVLPALSSLTPTTGAVTGDEVVTLTGTGFGPGTEVRFGANQATVTTVTDTQLVVRTPIGTVGAVDVTASNAAGSATLTGAFTYFEPVIPPTVTAVSPAEGPVAGGTVVTITGTLFKANPEVSFTVGGVALPATGVVVQTINQLTAVTPAHAEGLATVTVRNPADMLEGSLVDGYRYNAAPTLTAITPAVGSTLGNTLVTLTGTNLRPGLQVRFGVNGGVSPVVNGAGTQVTVSTPPASLNGPVDVRVINPDAQQAVLVDGFTYRFPAPTLSLVSPASGPSAGGTSITLTGTFFLLQPEVHVGGVPCPSVTRLSASQVVAVTPPGAPGPAAVTLANEDGQAVTVQDAFVYVPPPSVTAITPANGPAQGGTRFTLTGVDFQPGVTLHLGGTPAVAVTMTTPNTVVGFTPQAPPGTVDVVVTNPDGQQATLRGGFEFDAAPVVAAVSPQTGSTAGGTVVTVSGSGFLTGAEVLFGTTPGTAVTVASPAELTVQAPARAMGVVAVTVRNPDGQLGALQSAFRYVQGPTLSAASPATGEVTGGTVVRLTGTGFGTQTVAFFDGQPATLVTLVNDTTLDAVAPPHAPGAVDVRVENASGDQATLAQAFTYTRRAPGISVVAPSNGAVGGGTLIAIVGTGFAPGATVEVGGTAATQVVFVSPELLRAQTPAHAAGPVDVVVANDDGQQATASGAFTYLLSGDGSTGVVTDGGVAGLGGPPDAGTGGGPGTGCGCSGLEGSVLAFAALGLLLRRRRR